MRSPCNRMFDRDEFLVAAFVSHRASRMGVRLFDRLGGTSFNDLRLAGAGLSDTPLSSFDCSETFPYIRDSVLPVPVRHHWCGKYQPLTT